MSTRIQAVRWCTWNWNPPHSLREVSPQQAIDILVGSALPGRVWVGKVDRQSGVFFDLADERRPLEPDVRRRIGRAKMVKQPGNAVESGREVRQHKQLNQEVFHDS